VLGREHDSFARYSSHLTGLANPADVKRLLFYKIYGREHWDDDPEKNAMAVHIQDGELKRTGVPCSVLDAEFAGRLDPPAILD